MKTEWLAVTAALGLIGALGVACASTSRAPQLGTETTFDGLVEVVNARASAAWIRPDFDLSGYTRVKLEGAGIEYRPVRGGGRLGSGRNVPRVRQRKGILTRVVASPSSRARGLAGESTVAPRLRVRVAGKARNRGVALALRRRQRNAAHGP